MKCDRCGHVNKERSRYCSSCGRELAINLVGQVLGDKYRILSFAGSGGMGRVYRAEHTLLEKPFAIKVLAPEYARDKAMWRRFRREALAACRVTHPNIASTLDLAIEDDLVYSVMEYVDGTPLDVFIDKQPLVLGRALDIAHQIALALGAAHDAGVIHRDIKPGNVMVSELGRRDFVKVVDFGLAVLRSNVGKAQTSVGGTPMGTPAYVAPELVLGDPLDARMDVYALGSVLYEMIVGKPPFGHGDAAQLAVSHAYKTPLAPGAHPHVYNLPEEVDDLIMAMLAKNPDHRPMDGNAVADALARILSLISSPVPMVSQVTRAIAVIRFGELEAVPEEIRRSVITVITEYGGQRARLPGDELVAYFDLADDALHAGARLSNMNLSPPPTTAVHYGSIELSAGGAVYGNTVNVALRLARLADNGTGLVSSDARDAADAKIQAHLSTSLQLRVGEQLLDVYPLVNVPEDRDLPVIPGRVRGQSAVEFTCSCGAQGVIITGTLRAGEAIRAWCRSCSRKLSVMPYTEPTPAAEASSSANDTSQRSAQPMQSAAPIAAPVYVDESPTDLDMPEVEHASVAERLSEIE